MLAAKLRGDFHLVSANVVNHARLAWVHGMLGAMEVRPWLCKTIVQVRGSSLRPALAAEYCSYQSMPDVASCHSPTCARILTPWNVRIFGLRNLVHC